MPLVSAVVLPHAPAVFDGGDGCSAASSERLNRLSKSLKEDFSIVYKGCCEAAALVKATKPDVIFLNTPHGVCLTNSCCVYLSKKAKGNADWKNQWNEYDVSVDLDSDLANTFLEHLLKEGIAAEGMTSGTVCEAPLRWGEVVPLWFFRELTAAGTKVVIFSNSLSEMTCSSLMTRTKLGQSVGKFISNLKERVLYITGGELAHSHYTDCTLPIYLPDPRWDIPKSETAISFDVCVENWLKCTPFSSGEITEPMKSMEKSLATLDSSTITNAECWLSRAADMEQHAQSCGIYGFGVLHGILSMEVERQSIFEVHFQFRLAPTYFGMAAAAFIRK